MEEYINQLWQKFSRALLNFIKKNIINPEDAEDILQNVFLKIHTNIHRLKEKEKAVSWIYQITRNAIFDSFRTNGKKKAEHLPHIDSKAGITYNTHDESWKEEIALFLMEMVETLPGKYRSVLKWYEFDGLSHKEIARRLGVSVSGSKTRVQRSREKLKELLICGCRVQLEADKDKSVLSPPPCSHSVKMGQYNLCLKRSHSRLL